MAGTRRQTRIRKAERRIAAPALKQDAIEHPIPSHLSKADHIGNAIRLLLQPRLARESPELVEELKQAKDVMEGFEEKFKTVNAMISEIRTEDAQALSGSVEVMVQPVEQPTPAADVQDVTGPAETLAQPTKQPARSTYAQAAKPTAQQLAKMSKTESIVIKPSIAQMDFSAFPEDIKLDILSAALKQPGQIAVDTRFRKTTTSYCIHNHLDNLVPSILLANKECFDLGRSLYYSENTFGLDIAFFTKYAQSHMNWPTGFGIDFELKHVRRLVLGTNGIDWEVGVGIMRAFTKLNLVILDMRCNPSPWEVSLGWCDLDATAELADDLRKGGVNLSGSAIHSNDTRSRNMPTDAGFAYEGKKQAKVIVRDVNVGEASRKLSEYLGKSLRKGCAMPGMCLKLPRSVYFDYNPYLV